MDHLKSTEERKKRWYADHITPKYENVSKETTDGDYFENVIAASTQLITGSILYQKDIDLVGSFLMIKIE